MRCVASTGIHYASNPYDLERYERVRVASARLVAAIEQREPNEVIEQFEDNLLRASPLITADAVVIRNEKMLLIQRSDNGLWALPGGIVEVGQTLASEALRELKEETEMNGKIIKLLGIFDSHLWGSQFKSQMYHAVFLVEAAKETPKPTFEAQDVSFFSEESLPPLFAGHHLRVPFIFRLLRGEIPVPYFDE